MQRKSECWLLVWSCLCLCLCHCVCVCVCVWYWLADCYEDGNSTSPVKSIVLCSAIMLQLNADDDVQLMCANRRNVQRYTGLYQLPCRGLSLKKVLGQEFAVFRQTAANFRRRRLWVHIIFIFFSQIFTKWWIFSPKLCIFASKFSDKKKIFRQAKI